eukprot:747111-Pyramimonas_sp.AAC.1
MVLPGQIRSKGKLNPPDPPLTMVCTVSSESTAVVECSIPTSVDSLRSIRDAHLASPTLVPASASTSRLGPKPESQKTAGEGKGVSSPRIHPGPT